MERFHRYYALHQLLKGRRVPVARAVIQEKLECSRATVSRIIEDLRGYGAPIEYLRDENDYRYTPVGGSSGVIDRIVEFSKNRVNSGFPRRQFSEACMPWSH